MYLYRHFLIRSLFLIGQLLFFNWIFSIKQFKYPIYVLLKIWLYSNVTIHKPLSLFSLYLSLSLCFSVCHFSLWFKLVFLFSFFLSILSFSIPTSLISLSLSLSLWLYTVVCFCPVGTPGPRGRRSGGEESQDPPTTVGHRRTGEVNNLTSSCQNTLMKQNVYGQGNVWSSFCLHFIKYSKTVTDGIQYIMVRSLNYSGIQPFFIQP